MEPTAKEEVKLLEMVLEAAAAADVDRVRALPAGLALLELMAPREANNSGPVSISHSPHSAD